MKNGTILNKDQKLIFSLFLALTMTRVPAFREDMERSHSKFVKLMMQFLASDDKKFEAVMRRYFPKPKEELGVSLKEVQEFILDDSKYSLETNPEFSLFMAVDLIKEFMEMFYEMNWIIFFAPDEYKFLTSDNPLFYCAPSSNPVRARRKGLGFKNVEVTFPISPELTLFAGWKPGDNRRQRATNSVAKAINRRTVASSRRYVFSSKKSEAIGRFVQKHARKTVPSEVSTVHESTDNLIISLENKCLMATDCSICELRLDKVLTFFR